MFFCKSRSVLSIFLLFLSLSAWCFCRSFSFLSFCLFTSFWSSILFRLPLFSCVSPSFFFCCKLLLKDEHDSLWNGVKGKITWLHGAAHTECTRWLWCSRNICFQIRWSGTFLWPAVKSEFVGLYLLEEEDVAMRWQLERSMQWFARRTSLDLLMMKTKSDATDTRWQLYLHWKTKKKLLFYLCFSSLSSPWRVLMPISCSYFICFSSFPTSFLMAFTLVVHGRSLSRNALFAYTHVSVAESYICLSVKLTKFGWKQH